jgi:hypothetical protein
LASCWFIYDVFSGLPGRQQLRSPGEITELTTIFDVHDQPAFTIPTQYRFEVPLARMSTNLKHAIVAVEDVRFYEHGGIDGVRVVGAVLQDIRERRKAEGASTITQQLARTHPEPYFAVGNLDTLGDILGGGAVGTSSVPDGGASPSPAPPESPPPPHEPSPAPRQPAPSQPSDQAPVPLPAAPPEAPPPPTQ